MRRATGTDVPTERDTPESGPARHEATPLGLDDAGWLHGAVRILSPNFDARPAGDSVRLIVVHAISLPPDEFGGAGVEQLFTNTLDPEAHPYYATIAGLRVSAHFFIRRDGMLQQFVPCEDRAWHAGASCWRGRANCNDISVGIELEGCDTRAFEPVQYRRLAELLRVLCERYPIEDVVGHSDVSPGRKTDPGPRFDWEMLDAEWAQTGWTGRRPERPVA